MPSTYPVKQGDYLARIADKLGCTTEDIWDDAANRELSERRGDHNLLLPGEDILVLPGWVKAPVSVSAGQDNACAGACTMVRVNITFWDINESIANEECEILGIDEPYLDSTDGDGSLALEMTTLVKHVDVVFAARGLAFRLLPGHLHPVVESGNLAVEEPSGAKQRLANLGYGLPPAGGALAEALAALQDGDAEDALFRESVRAFQNASGIPETESMDDETAQRLANDYGC